MVNKYTDADVLAYWDNNIGTQSNRKRLYVDPRNYIIALLHYKFGYIEEELSDIFGVHRTSINHAKKAPYEHMNNEDADFMDHTIEVREAFPFIFTKHGDKEPTKLFPVTPRFNNDVMKSLKKYASAKGRRSNQAVADIVTKFLKKWDT
jgi:hypothetical protein